MNSSPVTHPPSLLRFWQPRYWPIWLGLAVLRLLTLLPHRAQWLASQLMGRAGMVMASRRRAVAEVNLRLCFPSLGEAARRDMLRRHFASLAMQLIEVGMALWAGDARIRRLVRIDGLEHLERAMAGGRGVLALSGHFAAAEICARRVGMEVRQAAALYRPNRNPLVDEVLRRGRSRSARHLIPKNSVRQLLRCLARGDAVWYAPDQSYRRKYSVLVPFLGEPAMTNAALTQLARISAAPVVPYFAVREADGSGYRVTFEPALADFPGGDPVADAARINAILERHIRSAPEQYFWIHRRFKGRPAPWPDPYARS